MGHCPHSALPAGFLSVFLEGRLQPDQPQRTPREHDRCSHPDSVLGLECHPGHMWSTKIILASVQTFSMLITVFLPISVSIFLKNLGIKCEYTATWVYFSLLMVNIIHNKRPSHRQIVVSQNADLYFLRFCIIKCATLLSFSHFKWNTTIFSLFTVNCHSKTGFCMQSPLGRWGAAGQPSVHVQNL